MATLIRNFFRFSKIVSTTFLCTESDVEGPAIDGGGDWSGSESDGLPRYEEREAAYLWPPVTGVFVSAGADAAAEGSGVEGVLQLPTRGC